jgi:polyhydroxybutyrate depolymerase
VRLRVFSLVAVCALCLVLFGACGGSESAPTNDRKAPLQQGELTVGGEVRAYRLFAPATLSPTKAVPLVMVLHGGGNSAASVAQTTQFDRFAATDEFIVVYPEGSGGYWNAGFCCGAREADDVGFLAALIDRLATEYKIDRSRVYLVGVSNGAIMAYRFACARADLVAAVASVAGAMIVEDCHPARPVSILELHGTADNSVPYNGGRVQPRAARATADVPPTAVVVRKWVDNNGCNAEPAITTNGPVATSVWSGCVARKSVTLMTVQGGSHTWFAPGLGPANGAIDATVVITGFLGRLA